MNRIYTFCASSLLLCQGVMVSQDTLAQEVNRSEEVVIVASRTEEPLGQVGSSVTVIDEEKLTAAGPSANLPDVLKAVPGVSVAQTGGPGGITSIFLRGANPEHTLVLIDGVEANDPISTSRSFNFATFPLDQIERIEIIRGPQSMLYGSDALGGVISIITKKGEGKPRVSGSIEAGSYRTLSESVSIRGGDQKVQYSLGAQRSDRDTVSAASPSLGNSENDPLQVTSVDGSVTISPFKEFSLTTTSRYGKNRVEIDSQGGRGGDDPNRVTHRRWWFSRVQGDLSLFDGMLTPKLGVSYATQKLRDDDNPDDLHPFDSLRSRFRSSLLTYDLQLPIKVTDQMTFLAGGETQQEQGDSFFDSVSQYGPFRTDFAGRSIRTNAAYSLLTIAPLPGSSLTVGGRVDDHQIFGTKDTWRITSSSLMPWQSTRFFGSVGTGFKAPSLYQLYSEYGSKELRPERNLGWDLGVEQTVLPEQMKVSVTYFHNRFKNLIDFDPGTFLFRNVSRATTEGVELTSSFTPCDAVTFEGGYTYTLPVNEETHQFLLRRPRHKGEFSTVIKPYDSTKIRLTSLFVGKRVDNDYSAYPPSRVTLGGYSVWNLVIDQELNKEVALFLRLENLFDKKYEEVSGFGVLGFGAYAGVRVTL